MKNIRLPPRVQLRELAAISGSYPTIQRFGDQERKGAYPIRFDDTKTVVFSTSTLLNMPSGIPQAFVTTYNHITTSLSVIGTVRKGIADSYIEFVANGELPKFFDDSKNSHVMRDDPFYSTGSAQNLIGLGFSNPLTAKTKIEIDVTPSIAYSASIQNGQTSDGTNTIRDWTSGSSGGQIYANRQFVGTQNYPMMYYNFDLRKWEGIGRGLPTNITGAVSSTSSALCELSVRFNLDEQCYGFGPSYGINTSLFGQNAAQPISAYGFPVHPKFHATSSQLLVMSGIIDRPFLLEKIVYEFSGSYMTGSLESSPDRFSVTSRSFSGDSADGRYGAPISSFFILNQRNNVAFNEVISPTIFLEGR